MALIGVTVLDRNGVVTTAGGTAASAGGDEFTNDGTQFVILRNASGGAITVTFITAATVVGDPPLAVADLTRVVAAGSNVAIGPFPAAFFNDNNGRVGMTYTASANLFIYVLDPIGLVLPPT